MRKRKSQAPFPTSLHKDIGAVLMKYRDRRFDVIDLFRELYHDEKHHGWELEIASIFSACYRLAKLGLIDGERDYRANSRTSSLFEVKG